MQRSADAAATGSGGGGLENPMGMFQQAGASFVRGQLDKGYGEAKRRMNAVGVQVRNNPLELVAFLVGGTIVGGGCWLVGKLADFDETAELTRVVDRPSFFQYAPEITNLFVTIQRCVSERNDEDVQRFREAVRETDALLELEFSILNGQTAANPSQVVNAQGYQRRVMDHIRALRDSSQTQVRYNTLNRITVELMQLLFNHVQNIRGATV